MTLLDRVNGQRSTPLAEYPGMSAAAQQCADSHAPCSQGPYANIVQGGADPAINSAMYDQSYMKVGIGYSGGYWVVFLN